MTYRIEPTRITVDVVPIQQVMENGSTVLIAGVVQADYAPLILQGLMPPTVEDIERQLWAFILPGQQFPTQGNPRVRLLAQHLHGNLYPVQAGVPS